MLSKFRKVKPHSIAKAAEPTPVDKPIIALLPSDSHLRLVAQYKDSHNLLVRGEIENFALHWQIRPDLYPTVALSSPCCNAPYWDHSAASMYGIPRWVCLICGDRPEVVGPNLATAHGINVNLGYGHSYDLDERFAMMTGWTDGALEANLNPLIAVLAKESVDRLNEYFMDLYRHGILDATLKDIEALSSPNRR